MAQGQQENTGDDLMMGLIALMVVYLAASYFLSSYIQYGKLFIKFYEVKLITLVHPTHSLIYMAHRIQEYLNHTNTLTPHDITYIDHTTAMYMMPIYALIIGLLTLKLITSKKFQSYKKTHNMNTLYYSQERIWPWIAPIKNLGLIDKNIESGSWAMSKSVKNFVLEYNLLDSDNELDLNRASRLFYSQLGSLWTGVDDLKDYQKALFACFIAHGSDDKDGAIDGLEVLSRYMLSKSKHKIDFSRFDDLIEKHINQKKVQDIINNHAYVSTVMCSALHYSRGTGPLPSSYFIWLKPIDRHLWFSLNNTGRKVAFSEISGVHAHWTAELAAGHAIERPYTDEAVEALKIVLKGIKFDN